MAVQAGHRALSHFPPAQGPREEAVGVKEDAPWPSIDPAARGTEQVTAPLQKCAQMGQSVGDSTCLLTDIELVQIQPFGR